MRNNNGFTLIEIIVIIVVAGIAIALLVPFLGSALTRSHESLDNLDLATALSSEMAKVLSAYHYPISCNQLINWDIENEVLDFDSSRVDVDLQELCYFDGNALNCNGASNPEVLHLRLNSTINSGVRLSFYFPCIP